MVNIVLIIVAVIMFFAILAGSIYILVYYQHEADKNTAWFPKILVVAGLSLSAINILLLPLDVGNSRTNGGIPMQQLWIAFIALTAIFVIILLPFGIFYYEAEDPDEKSAGKQIGSAIKYELATLLVFVIITVVLWVFLGEAEIPYQKLSAVSLGYHNFDVLSAYPLIVNPSSVEVSKTSGTLSIQVTVVLYGISILTLIGVFLMVFFGGVGLASLPMDLINSFRDRPKFVSLDEYAMRKKLIGEHAHALVERGMSLKQRLKGKGGRPKSRREKTAYNKFKNQVYFVEDEYNKLEKAYNKGIGPKILLIVLSYVKLIAGILGVFLSLLWIIQIIIYDAPNPPLNPFLNKMFIALDNVFGLFGTLAYGVFAFYLLWCVIAGCLKFGLRVPFLFSIHPMKVGETMMNSFMFNTLLLLSASITVIQFCSLSFSQYNRFTGIDAIFNTGVRNLRYIKYFWNYYYLGMVAVAILSFIYFLKFPSKKLRADQKYMVSGL